MEMTIETLIQMNDFMRRMENRCIQIIEWKCENDPEKIIWEKDYISNGYPYDISFTEKSVDFYVDETWAYGGYHQHSYQILFSELVSDDWKDEFLKQLAETKARQERLRVASEKKVSLEQKEKERALYEELKKKYESQ